MKKGFTLVEIFITIAIVTLVAAVAIVNILRARITANGAIAKANIRSIANAMELYACSNNGKYPTSEDQLTDANPKYLNRKYCGSTSSGYKYGCDMTDNGYTIGAIPLEEEVTGTNGYVAITGGEVLSESQWTEAIAAILQAPNFWGVSGGGDVIAGVAGGDSPPPGQGADNPETPPSDDTQQEPTGLQPVGDPVDDPPENPPEEKGDEPLGGEVPIAP